MKNDLNKTFRSYIVGFILSVALTLSSYLIVVQQLFTGLVLIFVIIVLAFTQLIVQLIFFLHLAQESKPRWNLVFFLSTVSIIFIIVAGSLWIMNHLNYNMTPDNMDKYMFKQEGIHK